MPFKKDWIESTSTRVPLPSSSTTTPFVRKRTKKLPTKRGRREPKTLVIQSVASKKEEIKNASLIDKRKEEKEVIVKQEESIVVPVQSVIPSPPVPELDTTGNECDTVTSTPSISSSAPSLSPQPCEKVTSTSTLNMQSIYLGVYPSSCGKKWRTQIKYAGKSRYIGAFKTQENAALAFQVAKNKLGLDKPEASRNNNCEMGNEVEVQAKFDAACREACAAVLDEEGRQFSRKRRTIIDAPNKICAQVFYAGKTRYIGKFCSKQQAALAVKITKEQLQLYEYQYQIGLGLKPKNFNDADIKVIFNEARDAAFIELMHRDASNQLDEEAGENEPEKTKSERKPQLHMSESGPNAHNE